MSLVFIFLILVGIILGSFGNMLLDRLPKSKNWLWDRSRCDKCNKKLSAGELLPIISFVIQGGKCKKCHRPIALRNLWFEIGSGILFVVSGLLYKDSFLIALAFGLVLWHSLLVAVMDFETMLVSDGLIASWFGSSLLYLYISGQLGVSSWIGALVGGLAIGTLWVVTKGRAMGSGDIGIALVLGFLLSSSFVLWGLWLSFVLGGVYGIVLMLLKKASGKSAIPFGPFLVIGCLLTLFYVSAF